jgi:hypothetical protein
MDYIVYVVRWVLGFGDVVYLLSTVLFQSGTNSNRINTRVIACLKRLNLGTHGTTLPKSEHFEKSVVCLLTVKESVPTIELAFSLTL